MKPRFENSFQIARIQGIPIRINYSWFFIFFLVLWTFSTHQYPTTYPLQHPLAYWTMGLITTLLLFLSLLLHELGHSLVAKKYQIPISSITLFLLGGVSQMAEEPKNPWSEFWMSMAGPLTSVGLALLAYSVLLLFEWWNFPWMWIGVARQVQFLNIVVALFNLTPGFPLDGGRIVRSILWGLTHNIRLSTRISSALGKGIAYALIFLSLTSLLIGGQLLSAIWLMFIAIFLHEAAGSSYKQVVIQSRLQELPEDSAPFVRTPHPAQFVPSGISLREAWQKMNVLEKDELYVMDSGNLIGVLQRNEILKHLEEYRG